MRTKILAVAGAAAVVAATSLLGATTASAAGGSNASGVTRGVAVAPSGSQACADQIMSPAEYPKTKEVDLSKFADFTPVAKVGKVKFVPTLEKRSVPNSWATWGSPPDTETATPNILYTAGATSLDIVLPKKGKQVVGAEVEPNPFEVHTFTAEYFKKSGASICSITRDADGNAGARVLAAEVGAKAKLMRISSDVDFAIGAIHFG